MRQSTGRPMPRVRPNVNGNSTPSEALSLVLLSCQGVWPGAHDSMDEPVGMLGSEKENLVVSDACQATCHGECTLAVTAVCRGFRVLVTQA